MMKKTTRSIVVRRPFMRFVIFDFNSMTKGLDCKSIFIFDNRFLGNIFFFNQYLNNNLNWRSIFFVYNQFSGNMCQN